MKRLSTLLIYLLLILGSLVMFFPFVWMFLTSLKPFAEIFELRVLPQAPTLDNYREVLFKTQFPRWFLNSLIVALITTARCCSSTRWWATPWPSCAFPARGSFLC